MTEHSALTERLIRDGLDATRNRHGRTFADYPAQVQAAVNAYDAARCASHGGGQPMSDANKATIAPMILAAVAAYLGHAQGAAA